MRASSPMPGDSWPSQMMITVENNPLALLELLWVREAWDLDLDGDVPPLLEHGPERLGSAEAPTGWQKAWPELWQGCLSHLTVDTGALLQKLQSTADGSPERAKLLGALLGPSWHERFGDESLGAPFNAWQEERRSAQREESPVPFDATPERLSLHALVPAWEAGLIRVVTLPCRGGYTRAVAGSTLILTEKDHQDPSRYAAALSKFAADAAS